MKILVTGGSGFIGTRLVEGLLRSGHEVRIFDKKPSMVFNELVTIGDIRDQNALDQALNGVDVVYHLAAEHRDDVRPVSLYYDINVQGARNIVLAVKKNNVEKIIFTSTVAVYGLNKSNPDEFSPPDPFNDYGRSKLQAEEVFNHWAEQGEGRSLATVRPVVIFGEGNQGNVYNLVHQIARNRFIMVGSGTNKKSMGYVGNLIKLLIQTMDFNEGRYLLNYADKPDISSKELVDYIRSELGITKPLPRLPYSLGLAGGYAFDLISAVIGMAFPISSIRIRKFCANTTVSTRALEAINFKAPFSLHEGLKRMIADLVKRVQ